MPAFLHATTPRHFLWLHVGLELVGLAVMSNPLRSDSAGVVAQLQGAGIRALMVTGEQHFCLIGNYVWHKQAES
jgi:cation transport ATPase